MEVKPLFRSSTMVLVSDNITRMLFQALGLLSATRVLLVADANIVALPVFEQLQKTLRGSAVTLNEHIVQTREPDVHFVDAQVAAVKEFQPDVVIGIGGGSLIDLAKAVSVLIYNVGPAAQYHGPNLIKLPGAKKIIVPTTVGTGSEVTPGAVVTNPETGPKGAIGSPYVTPDINILDPAMTERMPPDVMAATAMDALTHCLESYVGKATNPFARMYAREAFRFLINNFPRVLDGENTAEVRLNMLIGSTMAGFAIYNTDTGASQSMAYLLGTYHHVPHGVANALLIPHVMEHNITHGCNACAELYDVVHNRDHVLTSATEKSLALLNLIQSLLVKTTIKQTLTVFGLNTDHIDDIAEKGLSFKTTLGNNPVEFGLQDARRILTVLI